MGVRVRFWKGAWWVFINHQGRRKAKRVGDRDTAFLIAKRIRERIAAGVLHLSVPAEDESLETYARTWLKGLTGNLKASTIAFYTENLERHVLPALRSRRLRDINRADCRDLIVTARGKRLKLNTVKGIARTLSSMLSWAVEDGKLAANPALRMGRHLRRGDEPKTEIQPFTRDEAAHLVSVARAHFPRWHPWILCALRTGLRLGELLALQWGDIDWQGRFLIVRRNIVGGLETSPKSHQRRRVDMSAQLYDTLLAWHRLQRKRWIKKGKPLPPWVFASLEGTALEERNVRHVFTRMLEKAELRQIRIHDLRHTFASLLLQQGESIVYVKEQLGHASIAITVDTYGHLIPGANRAAMDKLDDTPAQPSATPAQPEAVSGDHLRRRKLFGLSGEPPRNRTENPQIKRARGHRPRVLVQSFSVGHLAISRPLNAAKCAPVRPFGCQIGCQAASAPTRLPPVFWVRSQRDRNGVALPDIDI